MKNKDLGSKKINNEQQVNEGFSGENLGENYDPSTTKLNTELEKDENGNEKIVKRVRGLNNVTENTERDWNENESLSRGVKNEKEVKKTVENKDRNSDITPNRYSNSHLDNHKNRGNIKLKN